MDTIYITAGPGTILIGKSGETAIEEQPMLRIDPPINDVCAQPLHFRIVLLTPERYEVVKKIIDEQVAEFHAQPMSQESMIQIKRIEGNP